MTWTLLAEAEVAISPLYPWVGPALVALLVAALAGWILVRRHRRRVWAAVAQDLGLRDQTPQTFEELVELRRQLSRHVLVLIGGVEGVQRRLTGTIDGAEIEVLDFEAFGVGHWAPMSVKTALLNPDYAASQVDITRDRPGFGELMQTAVRLRCESLQLPRFILMPENYMTRRVPEPRGVEMDENAYPLFARRNRILTIPGRAAADRIRALFDRPVQLALERNHDLTIEGDGDTLMIYRVGHALTPWRVKRLVVDALELRTMLAARG